MTTNTTNTGSTSPGLSEYMEQKYNERNAGYNGIRVFSRMPDIHHIQEPVWYGVFSWSLSKTKERWLKANSVVNLGFGIQTPMDVVRDFLDFKFAKKRRMCRSQAIALREHKTTPLYLRPGVLKDGVYVDIKSAYYSIVNLVGWDVDYSPGRWLVPGEPVYDFPLAHDNTRLGKTARACLVSVGQHHHATKWTGKAFREVNTFNPRLNLGLWTVVQDILHTIAQEAVRLGAIYCNTDGYILSASKAETLRQYIASWGLRSGEKGRGETLVLGFGNFMVGAHHTKRVRPIYSTPYSYVRDTEGAWLQRELAHRIRAQTLDKQLTKPNN